MSMEYPSAEQQRLHLEKQVAIGFKIVWTEVHSLVSSDEAEQECRGFTCRGGEFCIDNGKNICAERARLCINETLQCDGVPNCAENDDSDEEHCEFVL